MSLKKIGFSLFILLFMGINLFPASLPSLDDLIKDKTGQDNQLIEHYISETSKDIRNKKDKEVLDDLLGENDKKETSEKEAPKEFIQDNNLIKINNLDYCEITPVNHDLVQFFIKYYTTVGKTYLERSIERMSKVYPLIHETFKKHKLPEELLLLGIVESGFTDDALSHKGARGIWQLMPLTAKIYGLKVNNYVDERMDIKKSTEAAALYLKSLADMFNSQWDLVIASYNGGGGYISSQIRKYKQTSFWDLCQISGFKSETLEYVPRFHAILTIMKNPAVYQIKLPTFLNNVKFEKVEAPANFHLKTISQYTSIPEYVLKELNPHLLQSMSIRGANLFIPLNMSDMTLAKLNTHSQQTVKTVSQPTSVKNTPAANTSNIKYRVVRHKVQSGESLLKIARRYKVSYRTLVRYNNFSNPRNLSRGMIVKIPTKYYVASASTTVIRQKAFTQLSIVQHRVNQGETLYRIARRYNVSAQEIINYNHIKNPRKIYRGMLLKIPVKKIVKKNVVAYRFQKGETLYGIARRFNTSVAVLARLNKIENTGNIPTGKLIYIPNS